MIFIIIIAIVLVTITLLRYLKEETLSRDPRIVELKTKMLGTFPELNNAKIMKGEKSYTINKHKVYICTEKNGVKYDDNMLTYVILHELAHVLCNEEGHTHKFMDIFNGLLERAAIHNLYDPAIQPVKNYCK